MKSRDDEQILKIVGFIEQWQVRIKNLKSKSAHLALMLKTKVFRFGKKLKSICFVSVSFITTLRVRKLKHVHVTYLVFFGVSVFSVAAIFLLQLSQTMKTFAASTTFLALLGACFKAFLDIIQNHKERELNLSNKQLSVALSHMAAVAFDKQAEFTEKYIALLYELIRSLYKNGDGKECLEFVAKLVKTREESAAWLSIEIENGLAQFEQRLRELGAADYFVKVTTGDENQKENRSKMLDKSYEIFKKLLDIEPQKNGGLPEDEVAKEDYTIRSVIDYVREIVGANELVKIRKAVIKEVSGL